MYYNKGWCGAHSAKGETPTLVHTHAQTFMHAHARKDNDKCVVVAMVWMMLMNDDDNEEEENDVASLRRC